MKLCHNCPDRHQGCHAECEDYQELRAKRDQALEKRRKDMIATNFKIENTIKTKTRWERNHK